MNTRQKVLCYAITVVLLFCASIVHAERPGRLIAANNNDCRSIPSCEVTDPLHLKGILLELDAITGAGSQVGILSNAAPSLAFSTFDGVLVGSFTVPQTLPPAQSQLFLIDPDSAAATFVGVIRDANTSVEYTVLSMGFDQGGQLYGVDRRSSTLIKIDHTNALATKVGTGLGFVVRGNGGTIRDGTFYMLSGTRNFPIDLWQIDLSTGIGQFIGNTGVQESGIGLTDVNGQLVAAINDNLYSIDDGNGNATVIGAIGTPQVSSLAFVDEIALQCPCSGEAGGPAWKNHGKYVNCVSQAASDLKKAGLISGSQKGALVSTAAQSSCGK